MTAEKLKIAICGGGIASLCLAHALSESPHLDVKIFEKSDELRDAGASVGLGPNAQNAMAQISPRLRNVINEAGGVPCDPMLRLMACVGPNAGQRLCDVRPKQGYTQIITYWGSLYRNLYKLMPPDTLQLGKAVVSVDDSESLLTSQIRVIFDDNTTYSADAVIGCDGINSVIRSAVLGPTHPATKPVYSDRYGHRVVIPIEEARKAFGEEYSSVRTQHGHIGDNTCLLTDLANHGTAMQVIADFPLKGPWPHASPFVVWDKDTLRQELAACGEFGSQVMQVFEKQEPLYAACLRYHLNTPTFVRGQMCVVGDAAWSILPFHGAGAGQAIEDALILSTVLNASRSHADIVRAFKAYDEIRQPRRAMLAKATVWAGQVLFGQLPGIGMDPEKLGKAAANWGEAIYEYDCAAAQREALEIMQRS